MNHLIQEKKLISQCSVAQVHHHVQVGVGGHLEALASHGEVKFIQNL